MQINIKVSEKFISILEVSKYPTGLILTLLMGMIKHYQITQTNKLTISLQYLTKKLGMEVIFSMQINVKVSTSWCYPF